MASALYLQGGDPEVFGVPNATQAQIQQATQIINAYLKRQEGLLYVPRSDGMPCYMAGLTPQMTIKALGDINPGSNISVQVSGPLSSLQIGDVLVIDADVDNDESVEACVITSIIMPPAVNVQTVTLQNVVNSHSSGCLLQTGLVLLEQRRLPQDRTNVILSRVPTLTILSGTGRYGYGRRSDSANFNVNDFNLLAAMSKFGGPPAWEIWNPNTSGWDVETGQLWIPAGVMLAYYSEVKVRYISGYTYTNLPSAIKQICAMLTQSTTNRFELGDVRSYKAGESQVENFSSSALSVDMKSLLRPWVARTFG